MTRDISPERDEREERERESLSVSVSTGGDNAGERATTAIPLPRSPAINVRPDRAGPDERTHERALGNGHDRTAAASAFERGPHARQPLLHIMGPERTQGFRSLSLPATRHREPVDMGATRYQLRGSEVETLAVVGTFRVVFARDLEHYSSERMRDADLRSLHGQQLIERGSIVLTDEPKQIEVLTLTAAGKRLIEAHRAPGDGQQFYAGWSRSVELGHDAAVYRMVTAERRRIESDGGRLTRVVLDRELRAAVYRELRRPDENPQATDRTALAAAYELPTVDGHVRFPDVRLEYETETGDRAHLDLELVTGQYHGAHLAATRASGFTLYHLGGTQSGRSGGTAYGPRRRSTSQ